MKVWFTLLGWVCYGFMAVHWVFPLLQGIFGVTITVTGAAPVIGMYFFLTTFMLVWLCVLVGVGVLSLILMKVLG